MRSVASETAYLRLAFAHLKHDGVAVVRVPLGLLFRGGVDAQLRRALIGENAVAAIVGLPSGMLPGVAIESALIVLDRKKASENGGQVIVVDASTTSPEAPQWAEKISRWLHSPETAQGRARVLSPEQIAANDFQLQPRAYLLAHNEEGDATPLADYSQWQEIQVAQREASALAERMDELLSSWFDRRRKSQVGRNH